jgi:hypothetical protein
LKEALLKFIKVDFKLLKAKCFKGRKEGLRFIRNLNYECLNNHLRALNLNLRLKAGEGPFMAAVTSWTSTKLVVE